jgi:cytoskeleton protein RodZ
VLAFAVYSAYVHFFAGRDYEEVPSLPMQEQAVPAPDAKAPAVKPEAEAKAPEAPAAPAEAPAEPAASAPASAAPVWDAPAQPETQEEGPAVTQAMPSASEDALPQSSSSLVSQMMPAVAEPAPAQAVEQTEVPAPALLPEGLHHVEVIADAGECWMGFEPDGRKQQRFLRKGDSFTMSFRDSLEVKLGNISAVRVIYDGKELERSNSQRVMTLRFPPAE